MNQSLRLWDDQTAKWEHDGKRYCVHIQRDDDSFGPREWDNLATMACWHRRYSLGDKLDDKEPEDFWRRMVRDNIEWHELVRTFSGGEFMGLSLEDLSITDCMMLLEPYAEWLPLWLYDHSGITMSCGDRRGQYADRWDSGQVGWIFVTKERVIKECCANQETWRELAIRNMKAEVEVYDQYLTGNVYGFTLYETEAANDDDEIDWNEIDSCWGFYGCDVVESGLADYVGCGFMEAIEFCKYETGEAVRHISTYYTF